MTNDLLEPLAQSDIPPVPADFDRYVHERLIRALMFGHFAEFGLRVLPLRLRLRVDIYAM